MNQRCILSGVIKISYVLCMCCRSKWLASLLGSKLRYIGTFENLVPDLAIQMVKVRLTIRRRICGAIPFNYFLDKAHKSALARVHNLRNRMNLVIFTVSNPCIL